jgi:hypothetical protein
MGICWRFFMHSQSEYHPHGDLNNGNHPYEAIAKFGYKPNMKHNFFFIL